MKVTGKGTTCWLVCLAAFCLLATPGGRACPRRCACYIPTEVHCTFRYLTSIPDGIPPHVERINLGYNSLARLTARDFSNLNKLELLMLHSNGIHTIPDKAFADLQALQVLKMSYNKVRRLQKDTFYGLRSLTRLHMDHNNIEFINPEAFYGLTFLRLVHLEGNQLTKLHPDTFVSLRYLQIFKTSFIKYLYLSDNFLTSLPQEIVSSMPGLESLYLHGNPWTCDCHLQWLADWIQEKPDVIKCRRDRSPSGPQQCPLCMDPRTSKGKSFAMVPAAAFLCIKPTIDTSLKLQSLAVLEDSGPAAVTPQDFMAPFGSFSLNMTDQSGNEATVVCSIQKPSRTSSIAFIEEKDSIKLNTSFSTHLVCNVDYSHIQPVWQVLALYSDSPLTLQRSHLITETPQLCYRYKQVVSKPEDIFTNIEAELRTDPSWLMQDQISLQLNRSATTLGTVHIQYSSNAQVALPKTEIRPVKHKWTMISRDNNTKLERTVLAGGTIELDCPAQGEPTPHLEWLLADGSKVRAPYVSEDGRILIDKNGKLELQLADSFDTGVYHCVSTNYDDADLLSYRITVLEPSVAAGHENGAHYTLFTGEMLDLPCHSTGVPDASVSWVIPGNAVLYQSLGDKQILNNGTLRISQVTPKDQGHYHCIAANPSGVDLLIFQVSVKMKGQRPGEHNGEADGSGLDGPNAIAHPPKSPAVRLPTSALMEAEAGKQVSSTNKKYSYREPPQRRRGESTNLRFREQRRLFPPSARRIDPQHWAELLEKAKKNAAPEKRENTTVQLTPPVPQLRKLPDEQEESSGVLPPGEEFLVWATTPSKVPGRTVSANPRTTYDSPVIDKITAGTEVSPIVSPPEKPIDFNLYTTATATAKSVNANPTISIQMQDTANPNSSTIFPLLPGASERQNTDQKGRRRVHFLSMPAVTVGNPLSNINIKMFRDVSSKASVFLVSANTTDGHEPSSTAVSESRSDQVYSQSPPKRSTSTLPTEPYTAANSQVKTPRNGASNAALFRRFGRHRKIGGRGRIISPYRTPILGWRRYGFVRPRFQGSPEDSTPAFSAMAHSVTCPSCPPRERLVPTTALLSPPSSSSVTRPQAAVTTATSEDSTSLLQNPSQLSDHKMNVQIEKTTPTIKYFHAENIQVTPTAAIRTHTPTSTYMEKTHVMNTVPSIHEMKRDSWIISPLSDPISEPSMPTTTAITRFSRRKTPWNHNFVNNYIQKERLRNLPKFGSQKSTARVLPKIPSALPTPKVFPDILPTVSESVMNIPSETLATNDHNTTETYSPRSLPVMKEQTFLPLHSTIARIASKESHTAKSLSMPTAAPTASPAASASAIISEIRTARPEPQKAQRLKGPQQPRDDPFISSGQISGFTTSMAMAPPVLATVEASTKSSGSVFLHSLLESPKGISSDSGLHSRTLHRTDETEELLQENTQTLNSTSAFETALPSSQHQSSKTREAITRHTTVPPFLSSPATLMPMPTPPFIQSTVTDKISTPIFRTLANTVVQPSESSRHDADSHQVAAAETTMSPKAHQNATLTIRTTPFVYPHELHSISMPVLSTAKLESSKLTPSPWSENQFWLKSYPEIADKGKEPVGSKLSTLSLQEETTAASNWDAEKTAEKSIFEKAHIQKISTSEFLPFDSFSRTMFEKPRIVGGKAASFTVPANSDAFLPCEAIGNPLPAIHWTRVSSGLDLSKRKQNSSFQVLPNGTLFIQRVDIQHRGQYLCSASNLWGTDYLHVTLSVVSYPPRILDRQTKEVTVHSGSTVELKCRAEGSPSPIISWILANQTVVLESSKGSRQVLVRSDGTLVLHNLSVYDRGFYKCMASNPAGQDSVLVKIQVIAAPPVILEQKRQVLIGTPGESLRLPCTAEGTPQPSVHWVLSDGTEVKPLQLINSKLFLFSNGTLYIRDVASSDRATYECIATSSTGSDRRVVTLMVEEPESTPRIEVASPRWTEVNLGDKLLLNCSATGEPKPKIMWRLPSKAVVDQRHRMGSRIHVYPNGSLSIGSVTEKDGGVYLCVARNRMGDDVIRMHVGLRLKPARIDQKQQFKKQVLHGKDFQVDCKASGSPVPEISWSLPDGTMINKAMQADDSGHRTRRYILFDNGTLYFNQVGVAEEGDYTCYAQNTLGKDEMKVHLTVVTAAPQIKQTSKTYTRVKAGDTAILDCEVTGEPKPRIFWLLPSNNMLSFSNSRYTFHDNGSLAISKVKLTDSGEYVCVARNPSGDDTQVYKLDVVSKPPLINGLHANKTIMRVTAVRHSKKHFDCRAEGAPAPQVTWTMPDNIVLAAPYYGSRITVHENGTLEIRNMRLSDAADFICVARNEGGESVLVVRLQVLEMLRRPTFRNPFNEKVVAWLGKSTALNCSVDGNPPPEIIWILPNGTRFSNGPRDSPFWIASNGSLIISKTAREDTGKYRCAARNQVGYIEKLIVLEIGQKPVILTHALGMVKGVSGESLSLHCVSDGSPKPSIRWTLPNGQVIDRPQTNGKYTLHENGTLVIKEAMVSNRGKYICEAQNSVGRALVTVPVVIVAYPPRITNRPPRSILTRTGTAVRLHCVALGVPEPEVMWEMPDHSVLSVASKRQPRGSELLQLPGTMVIPNPQTSDSGIYKCVARNPLGRDYAATYIQVI